MKAVVQCPAEDDSEEMTPVQGAELSIWKIAVLKDGKCIVSDDYSDIISTFQMSASENMEVSAKLSKRIKELSVSPDQTAVTDNSGVAYFAPVDAEEISVYLLQQTGASGDAEHYETMNSFLFAVPMPEGEDGLNYDVTVYPKPARKQEPTPTPTPTPPPDTPPDTRDTSNIGMWSTVLAVSLFGMAMVLKQKLKSE